MPFGKYASHGWTLTPIARGSKGPVHAGWNLRESAVTDPEVAEQLDGAGLLHAYSGTCAIDVDDMPKAIEWCAARGVDLAALFSAPDAVQIVSGKRGHGKLLYALPEPLQGKQVSIDKGAVIDFRCMSASRGSQQDCLPPTMHPDTGKPYGWKFGDPLVADWTALPPLPDALRAAWLGLLTTAAPEPKAPSAAPPLGLEALQAVLAGADADCDRETWVKMLAAVHHETQGSDAGLDLVDAWSARSPKYKGRGDVETRWRSFSLNHPKPITLASFQPESVVDEAEFTPIADVPDTGVAKEQRRAEKQAVEARFIFVRESGSYYDTQKRQMIDSLVTMEQMYTRLMPQQRGGRRQSVVQFLKENRNTRTVDSLGFAPGEETVFTFHNKRYANAYAPEHPEPLEPTAREKDLLRWLFARITDLIFHDWLLKYLAHVIQRPTIKIRSAPLIWSETFGNGKGALLDVIPRLLVGDSYSSPVNEAALNSDFNGFLRNAWHVNLVEFRAAKAAERKKIGVKLYPWITDPTILIVPKGIDGYHAPNRFFITATSNDADAAPLEEGDRRWGVYNMKAPLMDPSEAAALYDDFLYTERGPGVLRHFFLNQSLTGFNPNSNPPMTEAKKEMTKANISADVEIMQTEFEQCTGPFERDICIVSEIQEYLFKRLHYHIGASRLGGILRKPPFDGETRLIRHGHGFVRIWTVRNHAAWRNATPSAYSKYISGDEINPLTLDPLAM